MKPVKVISDVRIGSEKVRYRWPELRSKVNSSSTGLIVSDVKPIAIRPGKVSAVTSLGLSNRSSTVLLSILM